jgi:hypothetical protein
MKRPQVIIAITLEEYIADRREALEAAEFVATTIKKNLGYDAYAYDADVVEVDIA